MSHERYRPPLTPEQQHHEERFETIRQNWRSLPRLLRRGIRPPKQHSHAQEEARRRRQIEAGILTPTPVEEREP
jgi:hypothetical protein